MRDINISKQICCRSLGAGSEDVDGLTLTSVRSTTTSASKVIEIKEVTLNLKKLNHILSNKKVKVKVTLVLTLTSVRSATTSASKIKLKKVQQKCKLNLKK